MRKSLIFTAALLVTTSAYAQNVPNPAFVQFTVSVDHSQVTKYVIGYFAVGATNPTQEVDLGTGTPAADNTLSFPITVHPLTIGVNYIAKVKGVAGVNVGEWSDPSNPFDRVLARTGTPVVRK